MTEYDLQGPARVCAASGRELKPGDRFFAALVEDAGKLVLTDYAPDAWHGTIGATPVNRRNEMRQGTLVTYVRKARPRANSVGGHPVSRVKAVVKALAD